MNEITINKIYFFWYNTALLHETGIPFTEAVSLAYESCEHDVDTQASLKEINDAANTPNWPEAIETVLSKWALENPDFNILLQFFHLFIATGMFLEVGCVLYVLKKELAHSTPTENDILYVQSNLFLPSDNPLIMAMKEWSHDEKWQNAFIPPSAPAAQAIEFERLTQSTGPVTAPPGAQLQKLLIQCLESGSDSNGLIMFALKLMAYRNILKIS